MIKQGEIFFNHESSLGLNLKMTNYPSVPSINEEYDIIDVEGRNGSLYVNKGTYRDISLTFLFTFESSDIHVSLDKVKEWLLDYSDNRLWYGREDRVFRVKKVIFGDFQQEFITFGDIKIQFICEPFLYDESSVSLQLRESNTAVYYSGTIPCDTLFKIYARGNIQLTVDNETMVISNVMDYVEIDIKLFQVRNADGTSKDYDVVGNFVKLSKGHNNISWIGEIELIELEFTSVYR